MARPLRLVAGVLAALLCVVVTPVARADGAPTTLFTIRDQRLDELSGIARGVRSPNVFYVQNDSGDSARFFALDATSGKVLAEYHVPGAQNVDWEDLAVAPDASGTSSVWLADIGDNDAQRDHITIYRVDEPSVRAARTPVTTSRPDRWQLRYPHGAANAESLAVTPDGRPYLVTKRDDGNSVVYSVPTTPSSQVRTVRQVAEVHLRAHESLIPKHLQRLATGAAFSRDGRRFALRTYTDAYVWQVRDGDLAAALRKSPIHLTLPLQPQGEGICFDGDRLVLDSEQVGSAVVAVPLPGADATTPTVPPTRSAGAPSAAVPSTTDAPMPSPSRSDAAESDSDAPSLVLRLGFGVLIVSGLVVLVVLRRHRRQG